MIKTKKVDRLKKIESKRRVRLFLFTRLINKSDRDIKELLGLLSLIWDQGSYKMIKDVFR